MIARVAVFLPVDRLFDYAVPAELAPRALVGARVWAPWGSRSVEGIVVALEPPAANARLRPLGHFVDAPPIAPELVALADWMTTYYLAPPGEVLRLFLPARGRARVRRWLALSDEGVRTAAALEAALEPVELGVLDEAERSLLRRLRAGRQPLAELELELPHAARALRQLCERGLAVLDEEVRTAQPRPRTLREQTIARAVRPLRPGELDRAPRRAALFARIAAASTPLTLDELRTADGRAAVHLRSLVAAGLVATEQVPTEKREPDGTTPCLSQAALPQLNPSQAAALAALEAALGRRTYAPFLLHGVTGSGKTEVYLRAIAAALTERRSALVLVPEISLTPQLAARFGERFGGQVAVLHSGLSDGERQAAFGRIERGEVAIALGARSAAFAPLRHLGVVVVDEEHDASFKQEEGVRYNGRDVAMVRARQAGAVALLGSATPALETFFAAQAGRLELLELPERATAHPLPTVEIVDLRQHRLGERLFSAPLEQALAQTLERGEQAIVFLNRRGYATFILCTGCGGALRCRDCSVTLTFHRSTGQVVCHYCGYHTPLPSSCSECRGRLNSLGYGTEQVEAQLKERFPRARVGRLDRDSAEGGGLARVLDGIRRRELDIVVGTQMVTKGHDFPHVTLVGVVLADSAMGLPDFRASERTFQLLEQVAGRAGRSEQPGRVLVQTYNPSHPAVAAAADHAYHRFAALELEARREVHYPPYCRLACVRLDGVDPHEVRAVAEAAATAARAAASHAAPELRLAVVGPAEAPLSRLKGRTRWQLFLKAPSVRALKELAKAALAPASPRSVRRSVDVDPLSLL